MFARLQAVVCLAVGCGLLALSGPLWADPVSKARSLAARLVPSAAVSVFAQTARDLGPVVDSARAQGLSTAKLRELRTILSGMRTAAQQRLTAAERDAGNSEGALEQLYRSVAWNDMSFALAAFPYWRAWVDFTLAERVETGSPQQRKQLWQARKGFRSASMQLFQPSLVYGGWLGLGFVESALGNTDRAISIFENLQNALQFEKNHPLSKVAALELRLLRARSGRVTGNVGSGALDDQEIQLLITEAFALLEKAKAQKGHAREAALRLRRVLDGGYVTNELIAQMLNFRQQLAAQDLGAWTNLMAAEYALQYEHFFDATRKYDRFFNTVHTPNGVNFDRFHYHHAYALFRAEIYEKAALAADKLIRKSRVDKEIKNATIKLAYVAQASRKDKNTRSARRALVAAAKLFVKQFPNDPDADGARVIIAQSIDDSKSALKVLDSVRKPGRLIGGMASTRFSILARDFNKALTKGDEGTVRGIAKQGLNAWDGLPVDQKRLDNMKLIYLQMRAAADDRIDAVMRAIDREDKNTKPGSMRAKALLWARLRCLERAGNGADLLAFLKQLAADELVGWELEQVYPLVNNISDPARKLRFLQSLRGGLENYPEMDRRFRLAALAALLELQRNQEAYDEARAFVETYPRVGDGWELLGKTAALMNKPFEADKAWEVITDKANPQQAVWWDGMLSRISLRADSTRPESACKLVAEVLQRREQAPVKLADRVAKVTQVAACVPRN